MPELISEPITPHPGTSDTSRMGRGEPGLPAGFTWRGNSYNVVDEIEAWKESSREGARTGGQLYLRRHCFRLRMSDHAIWTVYCMRQSPRSGNPKKRWFLYTIETNETSKNQDVKKRQGDWGWGSRIEITNPWCFVETPSLPGR